MNYAVYKLKYFLTAGLVLLSTAGFSQTDNWTINFPKYSEKADKIPIRKNLWIFIMAGQSNMAGRGFVEPQDTLSNDRIVTIAKNNEWVYAKEPLHFYEPNRAGLDCGLSFGKELIRHLNDSVSIALIPCAIGGSSIQQWLGDSLYRNVKLLSNFKSKVDFVKNYGVIKGILWHQGESDAHPGLTEQYQKRFAQLISIFRSYVQNNNLPVLIGELGSFTNEDNKAYRDSINHSMERLAKSDKDIHIIKTKDLTHKGDNLHFDSPSQRIMGKRFAEKFLELQK